MFLDPPYPPPPYPAAGFATAYAHSQGIMVDGLYLICYPSLKKNKKKQVMLMEFRESNISNACNTER